MENKHFEVAFLEFSLEVNFGLLQLNRNLSLVQTLLGQFVLFLGEQLVKLASGFRLMTDLKAVTCCFDLHNVELLVQTHQVKLYFVYFQVRTTLSRLQQDCLLQFVETNNDVALIVSEQTETVDVNVFQLALGLLEQPIHLVNVLLVLLVIVVVNLFLAFVVCLECLRHLVLQGVIDDPEKRVGLCQVLPHFVLFVF